MQFPVNINYNVDQSHSVKNGTRNAIINHERREHGYTKNPSIDYKLSKFNDYNNLLNYRTEIQKIIEPYIKHHNNLQSVKQNPKRKIKSVHELLEKRGKRIPYKYIVLKFGDGSTRKNLLKLFKAKGLSCADYATAINTAFYHYAINYNQTHSHLKLDHEDTNLDEVNRFGGDHAHLGCLANSKTKSGKQSLSFDRATRVEYGGQTNMAAWHIMQQHEAKHFINFANQSFQRYLGKDFSFKLTRNPHSNLHLSHDKYIQIQEANDRLRASNQQLQKALISALESNEQEATDLIPLKDYNRMVDKANLIYKRLRTSRAKALTRLHQAKMANSSLQKALAKVLVSSASNNMKLITLKNQIQDLIPYLPKLKKILKKSRPLSVKTLVKLKFESENSKKKQNQSSTQEKDSVKKSPHHLNENDKMLLSKKNQTPKSIRKQK